jgi:diguanylate cyclase (GGDEF)-like protein
MTLFKQMALGTSILITTLLATVMTMNYQSSKEDMLKGLYETTVNNLSSLSSKVAASAEDAALLQSTIDAEFDSGYFKAIEFTSSDGMLHYKQEYNQPINGVPEWFVEFAAIELAPIESDISSGWSMLGTLKVVADTSNIYKSLYAIFLNLLYIFAIFGAISLVILNSMIHFLLKPLKEVQKQAEAVTRNEFIIQTNIPKTREFYDVVVGMNNMVHKVKAMFDKGNEELKRQKELEYTDPVTKLRNRKYLIDKLPEYLKIDASSKGGINMLLALSGIIEANEKLGHKEVDALFRTIAKLFSAHAQNYENSIVSRMNGTEFSILLPDCDAEQGLLLAQGIQERVSEAIMACGLSKEDTFLSIGLYAYSHTQTIGALLSLSDNSLAQAKVSTSHIHFDKAENSVEVMGKEAWKTIINDAIEHNGFSFASWSAVDSRDKKVAHNVLSITMKSSDNTLYSYGQFMASAIDVGLSTKIYAHIVQRMFMYPDMRLKGSVCSLRLASEYLLLDTTYPQMSQLFKEYASRLPYKLIIEIPDKLVRQNSEMINLYKKLFEKYNIEMGLFEFIGESSDYNYLQTLRPVYIKGESSYFLTQSEQSISALKLITDAVGISLIASGVMDKETLKELHKQEIFVIQGKVTELL